jgi:hypothetical protein
MKCLSLVLLMLCPTLLLAQATNWNPDKTKPPILGPHWARGLRPAKTATSSSDMTYHGGPILSNTVVQAIFWGTNWGNASFAADKISGMNNWYTYVGTVNGGNGSAYYATVNEYSQSNGATVTTAIDYLGHIVDTRSAPNNPSTSQVLAEVCRRISNPQTNGYYPVYIDHPRKGNYCAYHSWGSCSGVEVQFAFFWDLDGDAGCNPQSTISTQSEGLAALANVSGHELSEARSDPHGNAWYDSSGAENGDKCAWTFGGPYVTFLDGTDWKIQGNWSNYAYNNNTGYANSSGQSGCVDGTNVPGPYTK